MGCKLFQQQLDGTTKLIGYCSQSFPSPERKYDKTQRECLTTVCAVLLPRLYLEGARFLVRTDHDSLNFIPYLTDSTERLAR